MGSKRDNRRGLSSLKFCLWAKKAMQEIRYTICRTPHRPFFVRICVEAPTHGQSTQTARLSAWRPGRYELANYAKNVLGFAATNEHGQALRVQKTERNCWQVETAGAEKVVYTYDYYCRQLDSGACYADHTQVYLNPVNCCIFFEDSMALPCRLMLDLPEDYITGCSLEHPERNVFLAANWEELADSPLISSPTLAHHSQRVAGVDFHFWFQGFHNLDVDRFMADAARFASLQIATMGSMPTDRFHFLFQFVNHRQYHGVEHLRNTVITFGPGFNLDAPNNYSDLLGVSCHELFHVWNIKTIRPAEMQPYDYTKENYSRLGYVYEGVTTYYGDLFLVRSGVYSLQNYFSETATYFKRHTQNFGRFNYSVAESSFDTWVDGYGASAPDRKTNIYVEGMMAAMIADLRLMRQTKGNACLDDVMRVLYQDFGLKGIGYSEKDYQGIFEALSGQPWADYFADCIHRADLLIEILQNELEPVGCQLVPLAVRDYERSLGMICVNTASKCMISQVAPFSPAALAGVADDEEIVALNGVRIETSLVEVFEAVWASGAVSLTISDAQRRLRDVHLRFDPNGQFYTEFSLGLLPQRTEAQRAAFERWLGQAA